MIQRPADFPFSAALYPNSRGSSQSSGSVALVPSPSLLQNGLSSLSEDLQLSLLDALEPVAETSTNTREEGVHPEGFLIQEGAHFDAQLPESDGNACGQRG